MREIEPAEEKHSKYRHNRFVLKWKLHNTVDLSDITTQPASKLATTLILE